MTTPVTAGMQTLGEIQHLLFPATPGHVRIEMHDIHDGSISLHTASGRIPRRHAIVRFCGW